MPTTKNETTGANALRATTPPHQSTTCDFPSPPRPYHLPHPPRYDSNGNDRGRPPRNSSATALPPRSPRRRTFGRSSWTPASARTRPKRPCGRLSSARERERTRRPRSCSWRWRTCARFVFCLRCGAPLFTSWGVPCVLLSHSVTTKVLVHVDIRTCLLLGTVFSLSV